LALTLFQGTKPQLAKSDHLDLSKFVLLYFLLHLFVFASRFVDEVEDLAGCSRVLHHDNDSSSSVVEEDRDFTTSSSSLIGLDLGFFISFTSIMCFSSNLS
ncbi:unnamed protein product, partial [Prunus brigantina]